MNEILDELLTKRIKRSCLGYNELHRISKYIRSSIFTSKDCVDYLANYKRTPKITNSKNESVHLIRALYSCFYPLHKNEYLKHTCQNKNCINLNHYKKQQYRVNNSIKAPELAIKPVSFTLSFD